MNKIYKIGKNAGYDGCGLCLAAISDNEAVKIRYLRDICPDYDGDDEVESWLRWNSTHILRLVWPHVGSL